jgi:hypothetical protein
VREFDIELIVLKCEMFTLISLLPELDVGGHDNSEGSLKFGIPLQMKQRRGGVENEFCRLNVLSLVFYIFHHLIYPSV